MISSIMWIEKLTIFKTRIFMNLGIFTRQFGRVSGIFTFRRNTFSKSKVLLEAGIRGWESVFFIELRDSLIDYLAEGNVVCSRIDKSKSYLRQAIYGLRHEKPTHYCFDPRTGAQTRLRALLETSILMFCLGFWNVTPIVILTDGSTRLWRYQAFLLTGSSGVIVTFLDSESMGPLFTHKRVIGPIFMPVSLKRLAFLDHQIETMDQEISNLDHIFFLGSLYSQRIAFLNNLESELLSRQSKVKLIVEEKSSNISIENYWQKIASHMSLITTTLQEQSSYYIMDRLYIGQMVFRISEALAAGKLLFCPNVAGMSRYFEEGIHFVSYTSFSDAADKIIFMSDHPAVAIKIATQGRNRYRKFTEESAFWRSVDQLLAVKLTTNAHSTS